jgi:adenosylhomocysteine nucleosidase
MKILIVLAVEPEFDPWRKLRKFRESAVGSFTVRQTEIARASVDFVVTGMGPTHAARAMDAVDGSPYSICIASGFAGALQPELQVGEIIVPKTVRRASAADAIVCDAALVAEVVSAGATSIDALVSSDRIATTVSEKGQLAEFGAAVDMESFAVLSGVRGTRSLAVRVVSDRHDQAMPVDLSTTVDERGQVSVGRVLKMVAGNPGQLSALMKLGRESKAAAEVLAKFLNGFVEQIPSLG